MNRQRLGQPLRGAAVTVLGPDGRPLVRTRTDQNGEYAAIGFSDGVALVVASVPGRQAATRDFSSAQHNP